MSLLALQSRFRDEIIADDDGLPPSSTGMAIYRDAYRGRLLAALEASFERTRRWTGEDAFAAAACHYILTCPPRSWTLDDYGADFSVLLATLFSDDPEVAELAWLEWHVSRAFAAPNRPVLDAAKLAAACSAPADWDRMTFAMSAGFAMRGVQTNCLALWDALADGQSAPPAAQRNDFTALLIWRSGFRPSVRAATCAEAEALNLLAGGGSLGELAQADSAGKLGEWLAQWFSEGIFAEA